MKPYCKLCDEFEDSIERALSATNVTEVLMYLSFASEIINRSKEIDKNGDICFCATHKLEKVTRHILSLILDDELMQQVNARVSDHSMYPELEVKGIK